MNKSFIHSYVVSKKATVKLQVKLFHCKMLTVAFVLNRVLKLIDITMQY